MCLLATDKINKRVDTNGDRELSSVFTKVEIYPRLDDAKAVYTCEAQHPALKAPLRSSVVLSVLCTYLSRLISRPDGHLSVSNTHEQRRASPSRNQQRLF